MAYTSEASKSEISWNINAFDNPQEYSGPIGWSRLITGIICLEKGTYPSAPDMGVDILSYQYETDETFKTHVSDEIDYQIRTYLPEIPLESVVVTTYTSEFGHMYAVILIKYLHDNSLSPTAIIYEFKGKIVNFEVIM